MVLPQGVGQRQDGQESCSPHGEERDGSHKVGSTYGSKHKWDVDSAKGWCYHFLINCAPLTNFIMLLKNGILVKRE